jgi:hypothetical protein
LKGLKKQKAGKIEKNIQKEKRRAKTVHGKEEVCRLVLRIIAIRDPNLRLLDSYRLPEVDTKF